MLKALEIDLEGTWEVEAEDRLGWPFSNVSIEVLCLIGKPSDTDSSSVVTQTQDHHTGAARLTREHIAGRSCRGQFSLDFKNHMKELTL